MMWLKSCPRCATGDMYLDEDDARHCLQCGYTQESAVSTASSGDVAAVLETIGSVGDLLAPEVLLGHSRSSSEVQSRRLVLNREVT